MPYEILSSAQMQEADRLAIQSGVPGFTLMQNAGIATAKVITGRFRRGQALVLCGPGNNGGDGFVIAAQLKKAGWKVRVASLIHLADFKGDAARAATLWKGPVENFRDINVHARDVVIDAVFGTGFARALKEPVISVFQAVRSQGNPVIAVDIPSGINGTTGETDPHVLPAGLTVAFCRKKTGHLLEPGKSACGEVIAVDIGIQDYIVRQTKPLVFENHPGLWRELFPERQALAHKYRYGHAVIFGAAQMTGAARLAAEACARIGAGLTTVIAEGDSGFIYRVTLPPHIIVEDMGDNIYRHVEDERRNAVLVGPGGGRDFTRLREIITTVCGLGRTTVLDADALNALAETKAMGVLHPGCVLTPHEGEFAKLFLGLAGNRLECARSAAQQARCLVVLKGSDTVVAAPDGRAAINTGAPPNLATAGTGDVLAGMITGLLAQGMPPFEAACAGVWIHGECARRIGPGLVATDILTKIPSVLQDLLS